MDRTRPMRAPKLRTVFGCVAVCLLTAVSAQPSLFAPKNFIDYDEDPLISLLKDRLTADSPSEEDNLVENEFYDPSDFFMDKSRFRIRHEARWTPKPLGRTPLGQIAGVDTDLKGNPVIFHRAEKGWSRSKKPPVIKGNTIVVLDRRSGKVLSSWGNNTFYVPHGITIDHRGNVWVTDTGSHQVLKFLPGSTKPSVVLGKKFESGSDKTHFCRPTDVAVATNGAFFVSDGYCNKRVIKFDADGRFVREYVYDMNVVHDLTLIEERDAICAADRERGRIVCFSAGLRHHLQQQQQEQDQKYPGSRKPVSVDYSKPIAIFPLADILGSVYAITNLGPTIFAVGDPGRKNYAKAHGVVLNFDKGNVLNTFERAATQAKDRNALVRPHDVVVSKDGRTLYVAEIGPNRLSKFNIKH